MLKLCEYDQVEFETKRSDAKYCPLPKKCRQYAAKKAGVNPETCEIVHQAGGAGPAADAAVQEEIVFNDPPKHKFGKPVVLDPKMQVTSIPQMTMEQWERYSNPKDPLYIENPFRRPPRPGYDKAKALKAFQKMGLAKVEWITTGIAEFDDLTRIPRGRITQIQGPYGVGKTTLCLNMAAGISQNNKVLYIDSEAALNPQLITDLEVNENNFTLYNESANLEDIAEVIRKAVEKPTYDIIIFDSLAMSTTKAIADADFTASNIGQKAKLMHKLISLVQMDCKNTDTALVVINQEREVLGSYVPQKYTPGGMAVPYAASLIVALKTIKSWRFPDKPKDGVYLGQQVEATIIKSKVNQPWRVKKFKLYYPNPIAAVEEKTREAF